MADDTASNERLEVNDKDEKIEEWSDELCIRISMEDKFPANVKDSTIQKSIINRFLNFYLSGKIQKGLNAKDIIFAVIAIMPYSLDSEELIWRDYHYDENGNMFYLTPEDKLKTEIQVLITKHKQNSIQNETEHQDKNELNNVPKMSNSETNIDVVKYETDRDNDTSATPDQENDPRDGSESTSNQNNGTTESPNEDDDDKLVWFRKKAFDRESVKIESKEYGPVENSAFCISCNKLLDKWDTDMTARIQLKYFFGCAALSLMRTIAKSYQHVINMFTNTFPRTVQCTHCIRYSPPNKACVKKTFKTLRKMERKTQIMFAKLVINSFILNYRYNVKREDRNTGGIVNVFKITVLAHTSGYGMDIITMLQEVAARTFYFCKLFELLNVEETAVSWNKVNNFFKKYMCKSSNKPTCHWARIIDKEQFKYLSCENNYELAVLIAVFIEKLSQNDGIWNARWVKTGTNLETYKQLGLKIYEDYKKKSVECFFTPLQIQFTLKPFC